MMNWIIQNNFKDADFWITNKGSVQTVGKPTKEFHPSLTGIKCPDFVLPQYGYYLAVYLHSIGLWKKYAIGSLNYKHLRLHDIRSFFKQLQPGLNSGNKIAFDLALLLDSKNQL
ncbi:MAG: hypothetical protein ACLFQP_00560 [Halothece sp.]